jgi:phosphoesterase RecJ-like protein
VLSIGKDVRAVLETEAPRKYRFLKGIGELIATPTVERSWRPDAAIVLECPTRERMGSAVRLLSEEVQIINIDHHRDNNLYGTVNWVNAEMSSVGEMVYEYLSDVGFVVTPSMAEQLYTAIMTDTGRFRFSATSARTMHIIGNLIASGANPQRIHDQVYYRLEPPAMKLFGLVLSSIEFCEQGTVSVLTLTNEMLTRSGADISETEGLVDYTLYAQGVVVGMLLKETAPNCTKVSLRSRDSIDVADIARKFGGGGHMNAAGCVIESSVGKARELVLQALKDSGNGQKN